MSREEPVLSSQPVAALPFLKSRTLSRVTERVSGRIVLAAALALAVWAAHPSGQESKAETLILRGVTLIDGLGGTPRANTTIVIRDGRVAEVRSGAAAATMPVGATELDVAGSYVIPGLIDAHVHLATTPRPSAVLTALMQAALLGGVTAVRDMGGNGAIVAELARAAEASGAASPAVFSSAVFAGPDAFWFTDARAAYFRNNRTLSDAPWLVRVDQSTDLRAAVTRAKAFGATGIKIYSHLTRSSVSDIANEARRQRLQVWSQSTIIPANPGDAVNARPSTLSHAEYLVWQGRTGVRTELFGRPGGMVDAMNAVSPDAEPIVRLLRTMRERSVMLEPTLYIGVQAAGLAADDQRPRIDQQTTYAASITAQALKAGVGIVAGTDALGGSSPNIHAELQLLVQRAGLTPVQAIQAATFNAARALGKSGDIGSVVVGRQADLVVLEQDPAADIRNTQTIRMVIRSGVVHRRTIPMSVGPYAEPPPRVAP